MLKLRKRLILLLMLILPVQGWAAAYAPIHMALGAQATAGMPCHEQPAQHAGHHVAASSSTNDSTSGAARDTDAASHLCCQQVFTGATSSVWSAAARKFSDVSRFVLPLSTLFIPDAPDRPPRG